MIVLLSLNTGASIGEGLWHAHCLLCEVQLSLLNYTDAEQSASTALELLKKKNKDEPLVRLLLLRALSFSDQPDDWDRAAELLREVSVKLLIHTYWLMFTNLSLLIIIVIISTCLPIVEQTSPQSLYGDFSHEKFLSSSVFHSN